MLLRHESTWFPLVFIILLPNMMKISCESQLVIEHYVLKVSCICAVCNDTILSNACFF